MGRQEIELWKAANSRVNQLTTQLCTAKIMMIQQVFKHYSVNFFLEKYKTMWSSQVSAGLSMPNLGFLVKQQSFTYTNLTWGLSVNNSSFITCTFRSLDNKYCIHSKLSSKKQEKRLTNITSIQTFCKWPNKNLLKSEKLYRIKGDVVIKLIESN